MLNETSSVIFKHHVHLENFLLYPYPFHLRVSHENLQLLAFPWLFLSESCYLESWLCFLLLIKWIRDTLNKHYFTASLMLLLMRWACLTLANRIGKISTWTSFYMNLCPVKVSPEGKIKRALFRSGATEARRAEGAKRFNFFFSVGGVYLPNFLYWRIFGITKFIAHHTKNYQ